MVGAASENRNSATWSSLIRKRSKKSSGASQYLVLGSSVV